jgi:type IV pilus assembly protein PilP
MTFKRSSAAWRYVALITATLFLWGCADNDMSDLDAFLAEKRARPGGVIEPIPTFTAYEAFAYAATGQRAPFDRPVEVRQITRLSARSTIQPDLDRPREFLEQFTLDSLQMVGRLERGGTYWSLMRDPQGGIHRVSSGNFLGRDHGRVTEMGDTFVAVIEIVTDGTAEGWVERPRVIELTGS